MIWSWINTRSNILWPLRLTRSALKVKKSWNLWKSWHKLFRIVSARKIWQIFQIQCMIENRGLTFWNFPRHWKISQSRAISSQRPKCANLASAGANAYETVGNGRVKIRGKATRSVQGKNFWLPGFGAFSDSGFFGRPRPGILGLRRVCQGEETSTSYLNQPVLGDCAVQWANRVLTPTVTTIGHLKPRSRIGANSANSIDRHRPTLRMMELNR